MSFKYFYCHNICMEKASLALIYDRRSVSPDEARSALRGMERFARFGLGCEGIEVSDRKAVAGVKRGERIAGIIGQERAVLSVLDLRAMGIREFFGNERKALGVGLMAGELLSLRDEGAERATGLSHEGSGGVVTLRRIRLLEPRVASMAIEAAVAHEAGHILGIGGHCKDEGCLMRENQRLEDFIEITVKMARDICRRCESVIGTYVSGLGQARY